MVFSRHVRVLVLSSAAAAVISLSSTRLAAQARAPKPATASVSGELGKKLRDGDAAVQKAALDEIRINGRAASHLAGDVAELLDRGVPKVVTEAALETLGDLEVPEVAKSIAAYTVHRDLRLRRLAVQSLVRVKGPVAVRALRDRLSDSDAMVRGTAASGLGSMKAREALPELFVALDHKVAEAAATIGQLCNPKECDDFANRLGRQPFEVMTGGFDQILFRPNSEIPEDAKIKIIGRVRELGTADASKFLREISKRLPKTTSGRIKQAIEQAIAATGGGQ